MQTHRTYNIVPYNSDWPKQYAQLAQIINSILEKNAVRIEHIGSTAIPGMSAKPQIDIMVEVKSLDEVKHVYHDLEEAGFTPRGDYGGSLKGEEYFTKDNSAGERLASLHIYESGNLKIVRNLRFRDYLRAHPEEMDRYILAKQELFQKFSDDYPAYNRGKNEIISDITLRAENQ